METIIPSEAQEQQAIVQWLTIKKIPHFSIPNDGITNPIRGAKFKRLGIKKGIPDLCIPLMRKGHGALWIELKRRKGAKTSDEQKKWIDFLNLEGYKAVVCFGFDEAIKIIENYIL